MKMLIAAVSMFVAAAGCSSTLPTREAHHLSRMGGETRGVAPVRAARARALVSGPVVIKHLETDGSGIVTLYLADDPGIADRACPSADAEGVSPLAVLGRQSRITGLIVPDGKRICAAVTNARSMSVAWHAQPNVQTPGDAFDIAMSAR